MPVDALCQSGYIAVQYPGWVVCWVWEKVERNRDVAGRFMSSKQLNQEPIR